MRALGAAAALLVASGAAAQTPASTPAAPTRPPRIFIASDSTASTYAADRYPQTGWGQMLSCGLMPVPKS